MFITTTAGLLQPLDALSDNKGEVWGIVDRIEVDSDNGQITVFVAEPVGFTPWRSITTVSSTPTRILVAS